MYQERRPPPKEKRAPAKLWLEAQLAEGHPSRLDAYVTIDDLADGVVVLMSAPWPFLDGVGRLTFLDEPRDLHVRWRVKQSRLERFLRDRRVVLADEIVDAEAVTGRPVRIGDVFLVRATSLKTMGKWEEVIDVTRAAREAAKIAFFAAVAPRADRARARRLGLYDEEQIREEPPSFRGQSTAPPAV